MLQHWPRWLGAVTGAVAGLMVSLASDWHMAPQPVWVQAYIVVFSTAIYAAVGYICGKGVEE